VSGLPLKPLFDGGDRTKVIDGAAEEFSLLRSELATIRVIPGS
jgi:hypothetical protein